MKVWFGAWMCISWWYVAVAGSMGLAARCNVTVGNHSYKEEILMNDVQNPRGLAVDYSQRTLYFHFYAESAYNAKLNLINNSLTIIEELRGICLFTVDQVHGHVYAGCRTYNDTPGGLYQLDSNTGRFELAGEVGRNIKFVIYYNDTLFYSLFGEYLFYSFTDGHSSISTILSPNLWSWVFKTRDGGIMYNATGVYWLQGIIGGETQDEGYNGGERAVAVDRRGAVHMCHDGYVSRGIWLVHNETEPIATRLVNVTCRALTFDANNNIIYGDSVRHNIVSLVKC